MWVERRPTSFPIAICRSDWAICHYCHKSIDRGKRFRDCCGPEYHPRCAQKLEKELDAEEKQYGHIRKWDKQCAHCGDDIRLIHVAINGEYPKRYHWSCVQALQPKEKGK